MKGCYSVFLAVSAAFASSVFASEDFFSSVDVDLSQPAAESDTANEYKGFIQQIVKYGTATPDSNMAFDRNKTGVSRFRTDIFGESRGQFNGNLQWQLSAKAELDWVKWQNGDLSAEFNQGDLRLKDAFIDWTNADGQWLRAGHQIFAWGESEGLAITDILSPLDQREVGQAELQDVREQIPAIMFSTPIAASKMSFVFTYAAGHNRYADEDQEFYPYIGLKTEQGLIEETNPENNWEFALRWDKQFNGGDIALIAAEVNDNEFSLAQIAITDTGMPKFTFEQKRTSVLGGTGNKTHGNWLFKSEIARYWMTTEDLLLTQTGDQWRGMFGLEYSGFENLRISYELNGISFSEQNKAADSHWDEYSVGQVLGIIKNAMNDRLALQLWLISLANNDSAVYRMQLAYDVTDAFELGFGAVAYKSSNSADKLYPYRNNDNININVKYNF